MLKRHSIIVLLVALPVVVGAMGVADVSLAHSTMSEIVGGCDDCSQWSGCNTCMGMEECSDSGSYVACLQSGEDPNKGCATCIENNKDCGRHYVCTNSDCTQGCYYQGDCDGRSCSKVREDGSYELCSTGG